MMNGKQAINRLFLLATAPFVGVLAILAALNGAVHIAVPPPSHADTAAFSMTEQVDRTSAKLTAAAGQGVSIKSLLEKFYDTYTKSTNDMAAMLKQATAQVARPRQIFDTRVAQSFGRPARSIVTDNIDLKLYTFGDSNYNGYALKADLKTDKAMKLILGQDKVGGSETTLSAARRYGAIAGINAGGFTDEGGHRYPIGNTIYAGKYVTGFYPYTLYDLSFVGLNANRRLVGGRFADQAGLDALAPVFGASFTPMLLRNGQKLDIPPPWNTTPYRAPRTVIGSFRNGQILAIVTDGYDERGGSGATLAELQDRMQRVGITDAYNLDGGGSSTLIFDGAVVNRPSDGAMRSLPTHFLFFK